MTDIKRRQNIKKKSKRRILYCQSIPGRIVADHGEYRRDIGMSDGGFIDHLKVRRKMKQSAHKVIRQDGKQVVDDQMREAADEKRMEDGMRRFLNRKQ